MSHEMSKSGIGAAGPTQDERDAGAGEPRLPVEAERPHPNPLVEGEELNSIQPARIRRRGAAPAGPSELTGRKTSDAEQHPSTRASVNAGDSDSGPWTVQQRLRDRFIQDGPRFYFEDGRLAFRDYRRKLSTAGDDADVVAMLIEIARSRGWQEISLEGTEPFRREAWRQGRLAGLSVRGHKPSAADHAVMIRALSGKEEPAPAQGAQARASTLPEPPVHMGGDADSRSLQASDEFTVGRLLAHGLEAYRFDPRQEMSYFVRIATKHGRRTIWGQDLQRAIANSLTQPKVGDEIAMRGTAPNAVALENGEPRRRWRVEKRDFFEARAKAAQMFRNPGIEPGEGAKLFPELVGSYLNLHAAELTARALRDPEDRKTFVERVRNVLANSIARGDPLPPVRLRVRQSGPSDLVREQSPVRG
jgi:hypothetical protein